MNKDRIEAWVSALESGEYTQTTNLLRRRIIDADQGYMAVHTEYCALGVGMEVARGQGVVIYPNDWKGQVLCLAASEWYGIDGEDDCYNPQVPTTEDLEYSIAGLNDDGWTFWDIAQALRTKYLKEES